MSIENSILVLAAAIDKHADVMAKVYSDDVIVGAASVGKTKELPSTETKYWFCDGIVTDEPFPDGDNPRCEPATKEQIDEYLAEKKKADAAAKKKTVAKEKADATAKKKADAAAKKKADAAAKKKAAAEAEDEDDEVDDEVADDEDTGEVIYDKPTVLAKLTECAMILGDHPEDEQASKESKALAVGVMDDAVGHRRLALVDEKDYKKVVVALDLAIKEHNT